MSTSLRSFIAVVAVLACLSPLQVSAGLADKVKQRAEDPAVSTDATESSPIVVRLQRVESMGVHLYLGRISIGEPSPQELQVLFDTASGHILVPHQSCQSWACKNHRRYSPWRSRTSMDINQDGSPVQRGNRLAKGNVTRDAVEVEFTQADLGTGAAKAVLVRDKVCLEQACTEADVLGAIELADQPFGMMPADGIVGLGMSGLSSEQGSNIFNQLVKNDAVLPQFGISFGAGSGELFLGGHDPARLAAPLQWFPVLHPEDGFWEVAIQAVRLGNTVVDSCSDGCRGIVDTGASLLGVQQVNFEKVKETLTKGASPGPKGGCIAADLEFDLGPMTLRFRPEDYLGVACAPQVGPLDLDAKEFKGVYSFGETMLRRYYTAFDWKEKKIGFAPAAKRLVRLGGRAPSSESSEKVFVV